MPYPDDFRGTPYDGEDDIPAAAQEMREHEAKLIEALDALKPLLDARKDCWECLDDPSLYALLSGDPADMETYFEELRDTAEQAAARRRHDTAISAMAAE